MQRVMAARGAVEKTSLGTLSSCVTVFSLRMFVARGPIAYINVVNIHLLTS